MLLLKNGTIHDGKGRAFQGDILIQDGKIADIGQGLAAQGAEVFDACGKVVLPGFVESLNVWACVPKVDQDLNEHSDPVTPHLDVVYSFDPEGMSSQRVFEYGITSAGVTPSTKNVVGGQAAVFKAYGIHVNNMLVREQVAMIASVSAAPKKLYGGRNQAPMTRMGAIALLKQALAQAAKPQKEEADYDAKREALQKVLDRKMPLFVNCNTKAEMTSVELALKEYDLDIVFTGAFGVDEKNQRSIIVGDLTQAISGDNQEVDFAAMARLKEAGVEVAISGCGDVAASGKESLLWNAILWHKQGFDAAEVLKMITSVPARLLGVDDRIGSIETGKDADLVVWSANPIETYRAVVEAAFIDGVNVLKRGRDVACC